MDNVLNSSIDIDPDKRDSLRAFAVCLLAFFMFTALYYLRDIDDNSLTSWRLVFEHSDSYMIFAFVLTGALLSWLLSKTELPGFRWLILVSFVSSAMLWSIPEVVVDSSRYFTQAKHLSEYGISFFLREWGREIITWTDLPLVPFIYGLIFKLFGESRILVQILLSAMFSGTVALTAMLGRDLFDKPGQETIGIAGGALLLAMPYLYTQVPLLLVDVPSMFFLMLAVYLFHRTMKHGGAHNTVIAGFAIFLMFLSKYSLWTMASVFCIIFVLHLKRSPRGTLIRSTLVLSISGLLIGAFLLAYKEVVAGQTELLMTYQRPGLKWWGESFISTFLFQIHPFVTLGAMYSVYLAFRQRDMKYLVISWLVILMLALQVQRIRYLVPVFPMIALMAAYGISDISSIRVRRSVVYSAVIVSFLIAALAYRPFLQQNSLANLRSAGNYLNSLKPNSVMVLVVPQSSSINPAVTVPLLDIYTDKSLNYCFDLKPRMSSAEIQKSSFRFTWTYSNPQYYEKRDTGKPESSANQCHLRYEQDAVIAVIYADSEEVVNSMMEKYKLLEKFKVDTGHYNFRTYINVFGQR